MDQIDTMRIEKAMYWLEQGHVLQMIESRTLVQKKGKMYQLVSDQWHSCLSPTDFVSLFSNNTFVLSQSEEGIDEKKDEEYYAWRRRSL
ncbi:hypothetical protein [Dubosiella newyorkensis]|jgi:hypothetical protein|uniref:hypothetical protein n=1 Tax=Dubosiella newyorkensis TaxID=1862672 RepID=UPI0023531A72|nr:hypothetical protein [Dubosiella newyorkensis]MCI9040420.1 hypothetical protein [Dubosiella newyorkensis]